MEDQIQNPYLSKADSIKQIDPSDYKRQIYLNYKKYYEYQEHLKKLEEEKRQQKEKERKNEEDKIKEDKIKEELNKDIKDYNKIHQKLCKKLKIKLENVGYYNIDYYINSFIKNKYCKPFSQEDCIEYLNNKCPNHRYNNSHITNIARHYNYKPVLYKHNKIYYRI